MKLVRIVLMLLAVIVISSGCSDRNSERNEADKSVVDNLKNEEELQNDLMSVREAAWNSISEQDQRHVIGDLTDAQVTKVKFEDMINQFSIPKGGEPETVVENLYRVTFDSKQDMLGPIVIFVDGDTLKVVGRIIRD